MKCYECGLETPSLLWCNGYPLCYECAEDFICDHFTDEMQEKYDDWAYDQYIVDEDMDVLTTMNDETILANAHSFHFKYEWWRELTQMERNAYINDIDEIERVTL